MNFRDNIWEKGEEHKRGDDMRRLLTHPNEDLLRWGD